VNQALLTFVLSIKLSIKKDRYKRANGKPDYLKQVAEKKALKLSN
jgi:hypothetical protein